MDSGEFLNACFKYALNKRTFSLNELSFFINDVDSSLNRLRRIPNIFNIKENAIIEIKIEVK